MAKKLHISIIISIKVSKSLYKSPMHNLYAIFAKILEICKECLLTWSMHKNIQGEELSHVL